VVRLAFQGLPHQLQVEHIIVGHKHYHLIVQVVQVFKLQDLHQVEEVILLQCMMARQV